MNAIFCKFDGIANTFITTSTFFVEFLRSPIS